MTDETKLLSVKMITAALAPVTRNRVEYAIKEMGIEPKMTYDKLHLYDPSVVEQIRAYIVRAHPRPADPKLN